MKFHLKTWVLGPMEGLVEKRDSLDFEAKNVKEAEEKMEKVVGDLQVEHKVSDRFVQARLYQEVSEW